MLRLPVCGKGKSCHQGSLMHHIVAVALGWFGAASQDAAAQRQLASCAH